MFRDSALHNRATVFLLNDCSERLDGRFNHAPNVGRVMTFIFKILLGRPSLYESASALS